MPDGVAAPVHDFEPQTEMGRPISVWTFKSLTDEQVEAIFAYTKDDDIFLAVAEAKMIRPEGAYAVFEYNLTPGDAVQLWGKDRVVEEQKAAFRKLAKLARNEDYPVVYDVWFDEIG